MAIVGVVCLISAMGMFLWSRWTRKRNILELIPGEENPSIAILVAARDESAVIGELLESLLQQTHAIDMRDVYVVVERRDDPTVGICAKYGATVILRRDLSKQRKGYALDDAVADILVRRDYGLYFVFDADNTMENDFIERMLLNYEKGYQIATGYRNAKNGNINVVAAASSLTFAMINGIGNRQRLRDQANMIFSGTGFYVRGELVREWGGWPFHSLTEDYELSLYATLHGFSTYYDETAVFYDEQPVKYRQTVAQRVRWIKGYFSARKHYISKMRKKTKAARNYGSLVKERVGVKPVILAILGLTLLVLDAVGWLIASGNAVLAVVVVGGSLGFVYIVLALMTVGMLKSEKLDLSRVMKIKVILLNPVYLTTYVPCALRALLKKNVTWTKIKHGESEVNLSRS